MFANAILPWDRRFSGLEKLLKKGEHWHISDVGTKLLLVHRVSRCGVALGSGSPGFMKFKGANEKSILIIINSRSFTDFFKQLAD